jgi:Antibiotic biosynthesis monooxygenase
VAIKSITEFTIQPGRRDEFVRLFESLVTQNLSPLRDAGCSEVTLCAVVDDPDKAVEIADSESGQAREAAMQSGAFRVPGRLARS